jgi:SNF2 family DNA or RNA helicase
MKFVSTALTALGIEFRACMGAVAKRNRAIEEFKTGNVPILILSSEDSVAGLNLTEV